MENLSSVCERSSPRNSNWRRTSTRGVGLTWDTRYACSDVRDSQRHWTISNYIYCDNLKAVEGATSQPVVNQEAIGRVCCECVFVKDSRGSSWIPVDLIIGDRSATVVGLSPWEIDCRSRRGNQVENTRRIRSSRCNYRNILAACSQADLVLSLHCKGIENTSRQAWRNTVSNGSRVCNSRPSVRSIIVLLY